MPFFVKCKQQVVEEMHAGTSNRRIWIGLVYCPHAEVLLGS